MESNTEGYAVNGDENHWTVECPECGEMHEYQGWFDSTERTLCECGCLFLTTKIWLDDDCFLD